MASMAKLIGAAKKDLPITVRHEKWLSRNHNIKWSPEALAFAEAVLSGKVGGTRSRRSNFRASSLGSCGRRQLFKAAGIKGEERIDSKLSNIFATGNFMHLKWQMMGITEGWLVKAEVPLEWEGHDFGGTMDGVVYDGSLFEFKSINPRGYASVMEYGPKKDHILQAHGYMLMADIDAASFVYENKGDGEWREFRVERDPEIDKVVRESIEGLEKNHAARTLYEPLDKCIDRIGWQYNGCEFRDICLGHGDKL